MADIAGDDTGDADARLRRGVGVDPWTHFMYVALPADEHIILGGPSASRG